MAAERDSVGIQVFESSGDSRESSRWCGVDRKSVGAGSYKEYMGKFMKLDRG